MDWLEKLKSEMLEISKTAAYDCFPPIGSHTEPYYNYRYEHIKQVEVEALKLVEVYKEADRDIVLSSVWIHDRYKPQFGGADHGDKAADWALENLENIGFPKDKVKAVEYAVRNHVGWEKTPLDTLEAQILWDADKVAHQGPSCFFHATLGFRKYEPTISIESILPVLLENKIDIDNDKSNPFHLEETFKIHIEKAKAINAFVEAIQKRL